MIYAIFGCNTYTKHLSVVNLKFSFNWASCVLSGNPTSRTWLPPPTLRSSHSLLHYVCVCVCVCPARFFDFKKPGCDTDEARFTALVVKNPPANAGDRRDAASVPGWGDPLEGNRNPLRYSHLENPMDRGAWGLFSSWGREEWTRLK